METAGSLKNQIDCIISVGKAIDNDTFPYSSLKNVRSVVKLIFDIQQNSSSSLTSEQDARLEEFLDRHWL